MGPASAEQGLFGAECQKKKKKKTRGERAMAHLYRDLAVKSLYTDRAYEGGRERWQEAIEESTTLYIGALRLRFAHRSVRGMRAAELPEPDQATSPSTRRRSSCTSSSPRRAR
jgi:hypothetical protein